jgi:hypothetical protein
MQDSEHPRAAAYRAQPSVRHSLLALFERRYAMPFELEKTHANRTNCAVV